MTRLLDPKRNGARSFPFTYTPAAAHEGNADYLRAKFRRIRAEQAEAKARMEAKVAPLRRKDAK